MIVMTSTVNSAFVMTVVSSVPDMFLNSITKDHLSTVEPASPHAQTYQLTNEQTANIREYLFNFRLSLSGRIYVGNSSLTTSIHISLLDQVVENVDDIKENLEIFSHTHAVSIWNILKQIPHLRICMFMCQYNFLHFLLLYISFVCRQRVDID